MMPSLDMTHAPFRGLTKKTAAGTGEFLVSSQGNTRNKRLNAERSGASFSGSAEKPLESGRFEGTMLSARNIEAPYRKPFGVRGRRWVLVQAAMKAIGKDRKLANFYERVRKRSSRHIARVAVARKLAEISWIRLRRWHRAQAAA